MSTALNLLITSPERGEAAKPGERRGSRTSQREPDGSDVFAGLLLSQFEPHGMVSTRETGRSATALKTAEAGVARRVSDAHMGRAGIDVPFQEMPRGAVRLIPADAAPTPPAHDGAITLTSDFDKISRHIASTDFLPENTNVTAATDAPARTDAVQLAALPALQRRQPETADARAHRASVAAAANPADKSPRAPSSEPVTTERGRITLSSAVTIQPEAGLLHGETAATTSHSSAATAAKTDIRTAARAGAEPADSQGRISLNEAGQTTAPSPQLEAVANAPVASPASPALQAEPPAIATFTVAESTLAPESVQPRPIMGMVSTPVQAPEWPQGFSQQFLAIVNRPQSSGQIAFLHLDPPDLGPLRITINLNDNIVHAAFTSPHAVVRQAVENALPQLQQRLEQEGLSLGDANVGEQGGEQSDRNEGFTARAAPRAPVGAAPGLVQGEDAGVTDAVSVAASPRHDGRIDTYA